MGFSKSKQNLDKSLPHLIRLSRRAKKIRIMGSAALELAYVSCGRLDAYVERRINLWDVAAAAVLLVEMAGRGIFSARPVPGEISVCDKSGQWEASEETTGREFVEIGIGSEFAVEFSSAMGLAQFRGRWREGGDYLKYAFSFSRAFPGWLNWFFTSSPSSAKDLGEVGGHKQRVIAGNRRRQRVWAGCGLRRCRQMFGLRIHRRNRRARSFGFLIRARAPTR